MDIPASAKPAFAHRLVFLFFRGHSAILPLVHSSNLRVKTIFPVCSSAFLLVAAMCSLSSCKGRDEPVHASEPDVPEHVVKIGPQGLLRGGKPYFIQGAGGDGGLKELAARGGNSIRTWSTRDMDKLLDEAHSLGLTVSAGIWLENECSWFSYSNPEHCENQAERVRKEVMLYRDHPALLTWGIGNEVEKDGTNTAYWKQLDRLAKLVKELDPSHPTFTAVAGLSQIKVDALNEHVPHLDFVGINTYGAVFGLRNNLSAMGWKRPWLLSEWGPRGFWETNKGPGDSPLEQTSSEKAEMIRRAYREVIFPEGGCLGNYVFVWGWKFEATSTWFGIFTQEGETTAVADVLQEFWSGKPPANRAPEIKRLRGVPTDPIAPQGHFMAHVSADDPDGDPLTWHWLVLPEIKISGPHPKLPMPEPVADVVIQAEDHRVNVQGPAKTGIYRLHVWVKDGKGHVATANMPFEVRDK